jgi:hypothetical protein
MSARQSSGSARVDGGGVCGTPPFFDAVNSRGFDAMSLVLVLVGVVLCSFCCLLSPSIAFRTVGFPLSFPFFFFVRPMSDLSL